MDSYTGDVCTQIDLGNGTNVAVKLPESEQFANRLKKNARLRRKWAKRSGVSCYRVYDADLPDYSAAIDLFETVDPSALTNNNGDAAGGETNSSAAHSSATNTTDDQPERYLVIAEYAAPKTIDPALAQARFEDILAIAPAVLGIPASHVRSRARVRSRGGSQYKHGGQGEGGAYIEHKYGTQEKIAKRKLPLVQEGGLTFALNFDDYLDVGIFLDHRVTRGLVREYAQGARWFLNLFSYTGTATCYAADAGVDETVTVDLSNTYLDWAERNMRQNGFTGPEHHFVRADVLSWIKQMYYTSNRWDLIFCDPPTFSNSSKMGERSWDVQRDHVELLCGVADLLTPDGMAIFSCNLRGFRPDLKALEHYRIELEDITEQTIPEDFARNKKIHHCYIVRNAR